MKKIFIIFFSIIVIFLIITFFIPKERFYNYSGNISNNFSEKIAKKNSEIKIDELEIENAQPEIKNEAPDVKIIKTPVDFYFLEKFGNNKVIEESGTVDESLDPLWALTSGAYFSISDGVGKTVQGKLASDEKWRIYYNKDNAVDTDNGYYPQNIFRLVFKDQSLNYSQELYFKILKYNLSDSLERRASNGVLLFNRYKDANNLYYTGIRVDGTAVIKKKIKGVYYTLTQEPFYNTIAAYNREINSNLIPEQSWIGVKSVVKNNTDNTVNIKFYIDKNRTGNWVLAVEAVDDGKSYGGKAILKEGYLGIRTDFMDVAFDNFKIENLK